MSDSRGGERGGLPQADLVQLSPEAGLWVGPPGAGQAAPQLFRDGWVTVHVHHLLQTSLGRLPQGCLPADVSVPMKKNNVGNETFKKSCTLFCYILVRRGLWGGGVGGTSPYLLPNFYFC